MKTSNLIKTIGILCIIFGAFGMMNSIFKIFIPKLVEISEGVEYQIPSHIHLSLVILGFIGVLVNSIYITAGALFMAKKPYSFKLIYFALSIRILFSIVPMLILGHYKSIPYVNYSFNLWNLFGPAIDLFLIMSVFYVQKNYYRSEEEVKYSRFRFYIDKILTASILKILTIFGLVCLSGPLLTQIYVIVYYHDIINNFNEKPSSFLISFFRLFLQNGTNPDKIFFRFCFMAIILGLLGLKLKGKWRVVNIFILVCGCLILFLNMFSGL
jgi:hypothetical protein